MQIRRKFVLFICSLFLGVGLIEAQITFTASSQTLPCETTSFCIDVDVSNFNDVRSMSYALRWDPNIFTYSSHQTFLPPSSPPLFNPGDFPLGYLSMIWFFNGAPGTGLTLPDDSTIITLCLDVIGNAGNHDIIFTNGRGSIVEISDVANGNMAPFQFNNSTVTLEDTENPMLTCPNDTTVNTSVVNNINPTVLSDNCGLDTVSYSFSGATPGSGMNDASGSAFNVGTTTVSYRAKDFAGNEVGCSFDVNYVDNSPLDPDVLYFHPDITLDCATNRVNIDFEVINYDSIRSMQFAIVWDTSIITYVSHVNLLPPGALINTDSTTAGKLGVNFFDLTSPLIGRNLPDSTPIIQFEFDLVGAFGVPLLSLSDFGILALEITDVNGRLGPNDFEVLAGSVDASDLTPPTFSNCPSDTTLYVTAGNCDLTYSWTVPTVTDDCDASPSVTATHLPGATFNIGMDTVVYTATDDAGNDTTCMFIVTVLDTISPQISCPANVVVFNADPFCGENVVGLTPVITENCGIDSLLFSLTGGITTSGIGDVSGRFFPTDTTTVTYTAIDSSGNRASCSFTVEVRDTTSPVITSCPSDVTASAETDSCSAQVTVDFPRANDICGTVRTNDFNNTANATGRYPVGVTIVTWTVTDPSGNTATCSNTVTVTDDQTPNITCPNDTTIDITSGTNVVVNNIDATVSDNCDANPTLTYRIDGPNAGTGAGQASGQTFDIGTNTVNYFVQDAAGNIDSCSFTVTVRLAPSDIIDCPNDTTVNTDPGVCQAVVNNISATVLINPINLASLTYTIDGGTSMNFDASGQTFPLGTSTVEYLAVDIFGNRDSCSFTVTVQDNEAPTWANCPSDITVYADTSCMASASWTAPTPSDNCGIMGSSNTANPGDNFGLGTTTVQYIATDNNSLSDTCSFTVTVLDTLAPFIANCPTEDSLTFSYLPDCRAVVTWTPPTVTDCSTFNLTSTHSPGDTFAPGNQVTVLYFAVDITNGRSATCSFIVNVSDNNPPSISGCPGDTIIAADAGLCSAAYSWDDSAITASDDCGTPNISSNFQPGFNFPVGVTEVQYIATDVSGNQDTCSFLVTVEDREAPMFTCDTVEVNLDGTVVRDPNGLLIGQSPTMDCDSVKLSFDAPTAMDNCIGAITSTQTDMTGLGNGAAFPVGTHVLTFEASDTSGNTNSCDLVFIINDLPLPAIQVLPGLQVCEGTDIELSTASSSGTIEWTGPDNFMASGATVTVSNISVGGTYTVTITLGNGCTVSNSVDIIVDSAPIITAGSNSPACDGDLRLTADVDGSSVPVDTWSWLNPGGQEIADEQNPVVPNASQSGQYIVIATSANGCISRDTVDVIVANLPSPDIQSDCQDDTNNHICLGQECMLLGTEYAPAPDQYNWSASPSAGSGLGTPPNDNEAIIQPTEAGIYVYNYWVTKDGCTSDTATFVLTVSAPPVVVQDDITVDFQTGITFNVLDNDTLSGAPFTISIVPGTEPTNGLLVQDQTVQGQFTYRGNANFIGVDNFVYEVCYDNCPDQCERAVVNILVTSDEVPCEVPNVITPNEDGINDVLVITCLLTEEFNNNTMRIYSEWGDEVFRASPYRNNWEGTYKGQDLPDGTYYYIFQLDSNSELEKGFIEIRR